MKPRVMRRVYLREAILMLVLARLAVRLLPAQRIVAWASRAPRRVNRFAGYEAVRVTHTVELAGNMRWMQAECLPRALAAQAMLRRRGIASRLCFGVARDGDALAAHAWVELGQQILVGGGDRPRYTRLVEFGGERA